MFLSVDIGNSDVVVGLFRNQEIITFRTPTSDDNSAENYAMELETFFLEKDVDPSGIKKVGISSVVPLVTPIFERIARHFFNIEPIVLKEDVYDYLEIDIVNKHEIGSDLVANCTAAYRMYQQACIIVDFGTALTVCTVNDSGKILGVSIAPGLRTAFETLFLNTAKLPEVPFDIPESVLGTDTVKAIQAGIFFGYEGMVNGIVQRIRNEQPADYKVVATGGLAEKMEDLA
jgi:type III pantothenate kinase